MPRLAAERDVIDEESREVRWKFPQVGQVIDVKVRPDYLPLAMTAVLLACFVVLALGNVWAIAPTHDETTHLAAGWSYLATGDFRLNTEHPPLIKLIAALPLQFLDVWPSRRAGETAVALAALREAWGEAAHDDRAQWRFAHRLFFAIRDQAIDRVPTSQRIPRSAFLNDTTAIFRAARTTLVLLIGPLLFAVIGFWSHDLWGHWRSVLPVALFAFDPNFIAHTGLVTTDAGLALLMTASVYFFWRCSRRFTVWNVLAFAFATAFAHVTKFPAVILWPILLLTAAIGARENLRRMLACVAIAFVATILVVWSCYAVPSHSAHAAATYVTGFSKALFDTLGREAYLRGEFDGSGSGFRTYFFWAILLKTPIVALVAFAASAWICVRSRRRELIFVFLPPLIYFIVASGASLNIGHRHILPVYPFLYVSCGALPRKWLAAAAIAALSALFVIVPFTPLWGNHLAYFNELAGGPPGGHRYLIDSNLDWGQDLRRLGNWIELHNIREPIDLAYFGTAEPRYYGVSFFNVSDRYLFAPRTPLVSAKSRIFAISVNELIRGVDGDRDAYRRFLRRNHARLAGRAGTTIEIYEMAGAVRTAR